MIKTELIWFTLKEKMPEVGKQILLFFPNDNFVVQGWLRKDGDFETDDDISFNYTRQQIKLWAELPKVKEG